MFVGVLCLDLHKNYTTESESDTTGRYISTYRVQFRPRPVPFNHRIMNRSCDFCPWLSASRCRNTELTRPPAWDEQGMITDRSATGKTRLRQLPGLPFPHRHHTYAH